MEQGTDSGGAEQTDRRARRERPWRRALPVLAGQAAVLGLGLPLLSAAPSPGSMLRGGMAALVVLAATAWLLRRVLAGEAAETIAPDEPLPAPAPELAQAMAASEWRQTRLAALSAAVARSSHDLRGVLSPALLTAERLQSNADATVQRHAGVIVRAVERAADVMRPAVEMARETRIAPQRDRVLLRPLVEQRAEQARAVLAVENAVPDDIEAEADAASLERALDLLLSRAARRGAARARIEATLAEAEVALLVTDSAGATQDADFAALPSDPPQPLDLAIVRDLMRAQGGDAGLRAAGEDAPIGPRAAAIRLILHGGNRRAAIPAA